MLNGAYSWIDLGKGGDREKPGFLYANCVFYEKECPTKYNHSSTMITC